MKRGCRLVQLKRHNSDLAGAKSNVEELKQQLLKAEQFIKLQTQKVEDLNVIISKSRSEVSKCKVKTVRTESKCQELGNKIYGDDYKLPEHSSIDIRDTIILYNYLLVVGMIS